MNYNERVRLVYIFHIKMEIREVLTVGPAWLSMCQCVSCEESQDGRGVCVQCLPMLRGVCRCRCVPGVCVSVLISGPSEGLCR